MSTKTYYFFRCKTTHESPYGGIFEKGMFVGSDGRCDAPFAQAKMYPASTLKKNKEMYFPGDEHWEVVSFSISENDLEPVS